jgi:hypothetical protein
VVFPAVAVSAVEAGSGVGADDDRLHFHARPHAARIQENGAMNSSSKRVAAFVALCLSVSVPGYTVENAEPSRFRTALDAVDALQRAVKKGDDAVLLKLFGADAADILHTGDPVQDRQTLKQFGERLDQKIALVRRSTDELVLESGMDDFPFPIPLRHDRTGWYFDTAAGREELLSRRIGANELHTLGVVRAYVEAQYEYAERNPDGDGKKDYAERLLSSPGKKDGLYWTIGAGEAESPMGPLVAAAAGEGYRKGGNSYHGYHYKILKAQGNSAPGGERSYVKNGHLTGGFALVAYPAEYGVSGIMTFIVNQQGIVFQKDLGRDTPKLAPKIVAYDPDPSWTPTGDRLQGHKSSG